MLAANNGEESTTKVLVENGADLYIKDNVSMTLIMFSTYSMNDDDIDVLMLR